MFVEQNKETSHIDFPDMIGEDEFKVYVGESELSE